MKTRILLTITVLAMTGLSAFGQGYFLFAASKNSVWDDFSFGTPVSGGGHTMAGFIWGPAATTNVWLGSVATSPSNPGNPFNLFMALNDPAWHLGTNLTANAFASVNVNPSGLAVGGINYNGSASFQVAGTLGGVIYTVYCIGWDNRFSSPLGAVYVGWSNPFQYSSGTEVSTPVLTFTSSGMQAFDVGIPEPGTATLLGFASAALLLRRWSRSNY